MKKHIKIYRNGNGYIFTAYSRDPTLGWVRDGPCSVLPVSTPDGMLGETIVETLRHSLVTRDPSGPSDWAEVVRPLLAAAEVKSWKQFMKGNVAVGIFLDENYRFVPTRNREPDAGFGDLDDRAISLRAGASMAEIGAAAREAFVRSE